MPWMLPQDRPTFPPEFVEQARLLVGRRKVERRLWQRATLVLLLHENPEIPHTESAKAVGLSDQWVRKWRRRWSRGDFSFEDQPRSGRPPRFSPLGAVAGQGGGL